MTDRLTPAGTPRSKRAAPAILDVLGLSKYFSVGQGLRTRRLRALFDVSFELHAGEVLALVGESGSGKSTVLRIIARLLSPSSGKLLFRGRDLLAEEPSTASLEYRGRVQMIFQDPFGSLNPTKSVAYHLTRPLVRHGHASSRAEQRSRVLELLETVKLTPGRDFADKYPHELSGGQRQRVAIARALAVEPEVILADEPVSMLDVSIRAGILNLLDELRVRKNLAYLYVTHDIASARYIADRVLVMYAGHVVESGPSGTLFNSPAHPYTRLLLEAVPNPQSDVFRPLSARSGQPELLDPPPGCPFAPRCPERLEVCDSVAPRPIALERDRRDVGHCAEDRPLRMVRCHLYDAEFCSEPRKSP